MSKKVTTIVVSGLSKKIYIELGWSPERVIAIPNGIDGNRFGQGNIRNTKYEIRNTHIGCVARLTYDKGVDLLIEAIKDLPDVQLTIVGTGRDEDQIKNLAKRVNETTNKRINVLDRIDNLGGFYNSLDLLALPSREHDPFGLVAAEAMMLGIPVVVTTACGIAGYLKNCEDAVIVKANSVQALKEGIKMLVASEDIREKIAKAGKQTAQKKFTLERMVDNYETLLSSRR